MCSLSALTLRITRQLCHMELWQMSSVLLIIYNSSDFHAYTVILFALTVQGILARQTTQILVWTGSKTHKMNYEKGCLIKYNHHFVLQSLLPRHLAISLLNVHGRTGKAVLTGPVVVL
jgi:hypothetical protein